MRRGIDVGSGVDVAGDDEHELGFAALDRH
jgi:hypothetical protein